MLSLGASSLCDTSSFSKSSWATLGSVITEQITMKQVQRHTQTTMAAMIMIKKSAVSLVSTTGVSGIFVTFSVSNSFSERIDVSISFS